MKKSLLIIAAAALVLSVGCSKKTYYQVYQTAPVKEGSVEQKGGKLVSETQGGEVMYNFFAEEGDAGFWFTNTTDSVVYIDLAECFFVLNGNANDYYQARGWTTTKSSTITVSKKEKKDKKNKESENTEGTSTSEMKASQVAERQVVIVPPHATKYISEFRIVSKERELCGVKDTPKKSKPEGLSFTTDNTPVTFSNFITYKIGSKGKRHHVNDLFYVSEIINVNGEAMFESVREKDACGKESGEKVTKLRYATPDRYYVVYKR